MPNLKSKIENRKSPPPSSFAGKRVLIMGLGHFGGGIGAAQWFAAQNAQVTVTDGAPADKLADSMRALDGLPITYKLGGHDLADFTSADLLVVNPAVDRAKSPFVQAALHAGIPTTTEINLFLERCPALTVGITGSVGKSTTTALIHHALQAALHAAARSIENPPASAATPNTNYQLPITNYQLPNTQYPIPNTRVFLGGNIGRSLLSELPHIRPTDIVVLELSSFMLEETPAIRWSPNIAVITNLFPNHLDRHGTLEAYAAAKQNILRFQKSTDVAILNGEHELVSSWDKFAKGGVKKFTTKNLPPLDLEMVGSHNQSNARAALAVLGTLSSLLPSLLSTSSVPAASLGTSSSAPPSALSSSASIPSSSSIPSHIPSHSTPVSSLISTLDLPAAHLAISSFPGLAHRLQCVHTLTLPPTATTPERRLRFFNDSKATSPDASVTALQTFAPGTAIFIIGGYDKHLQDKDFETFDRLLAQRAAAVLGIGATGPAMIARIKSLCHNDLRAEDAQTLENAVKTATKWALELGAQAIVLSPASASWDQFPNYEKRGEIFAELSKLASPA
jgi:UDP-N-acetylmuramoylalanine--D-glutamate ligase